MTEATQPGERPTLEQLLRNEATFGDGSCRVQIAVSASADKLLGAFKNPGTQDDSPRERFPWEVWEGSTKIWQSSEIDHLQVNSEGQAVGQALVPVGDLLQAVLDTHPAWSVKDLFDATQSEGKEAALNAERAELDVAAARAKATSLAAEARVRAADAAKKREEAEEAKKTVMSSTSPLSVSDAEEATKVANEKATEAADNETKQRKLVVVYARDAAAQRGKADKNASDIYKNFTIWVNVGGATLPEQWVVLPIDMCVHGC